MIRNKADNHLAPRVQLVSRYLLLVGTLTSATGSSMEVSDGGVSVRLTGSGGVRGSCCAGSYVSLLTTGGSGTVSRCISIFTSSNLVLFLNLFM